MRGTYVDDLYPNDPGLPNPYTATPEGEEEYIAREEAAERRAAELDAAQAADPRERVLADYAADLAYEYSKPEYDDYA